MPSAQHILGSRVQTPFALWETTATLYRDPWTVARRPSTDNIAKPFSWAKWLKPLSFSSMEAGHFRAVMVVSENKDESYYEGVFRGAFAARFEAPDPKAQSRT